MSAKGKFKWFRLNKYQLVAFILVEIFLFASLAAFASLYQASGTNIELQRGRQFHVVYTFNFDGQQTAHADESFDVLVDLNISCRYGDIRVDTPVTISGIALLNNSDTLPNIDDIEGILVNFPNAYAFPIAQDENNITQPAKLHLELTDNATKLAGNTSLTWTLKGNCTPKFTLLYANEGRQQTLPLTSTTPSPITIYGKLHLSPIIANNILLTIAAILYLLTLAATIIVTLKLWHKNPHTT